MPNRNQLRIVIWLVIMATVTMVIGLYSAHVMNDAKHKHWEKMHRPATFQLITDDGEYHTHTSLGGFTVGRSYTADIFACNKSEFAEEYNAALVKAIKDKSFQEFVGIEPRLMMEGKCVPNDGTYAPTLWTLKEIKDASNDSPDHLLVISFANLPGDFYVYIAAIPLAGGTDI